MTDLVAPALASTLDRSRGSVGDYWALLKPRVMSLVVFTALVGLVTAPRMMDPLLAFAAMVALAFGAGSAGALNMWYDADIDAVMRRTRTRPVPAGRIRREDALGFAIVIALLAALLMALAANLLAAGLLGFSILFYGVFYTMWLKRRTPQNIVIGGAAGAFPPLIMQAAATGEITTAGIVMFLVIFLWTPPHFWSLALYSRGDYAEARVPMLPNIAGAAATRRQILLYSGFLVPAVFAPSVFGLAGALYAAVSGAFMVLFLVGAVGIARGRAGDPDAPARDNMRARRFFAFSILFLFLVFGSLLAERLTGIAPFVPLFSLHHGGA